MIGTKAVLWKEAGSFLSCSEQPFAVLTSRPSSWTTCCSRKYSRIFFSQLIFTNSCVSNTQHVQCCCGMSPVQICVLWLFWMSYRKKPQTYDKIKIWKKKLFVLFRVSTVRKHFSVGCFIYNTCTGYIVYFKTPKISLICRILLIKCLPQKTS